MEERTIIEVETLDAEQLKKSLGIPEDDIFVELAPGVNLFWDGEEIRRGGADVLPYVVNFILSVSSGVTTALIIKLIEKLSKGGGQTITIVKHHKLKITVEEETVVKLQKLLAEKETDDAN